MPVHPLQISERASSFPSIPKLSIISLFILHGQAPALIQVHTKETFFFCRPDSHKSKQIFSNFSIKIINACEIVTNSLYKQEILALWDE